MNSPFATRLDAFARPVRAGRRPAGENPNEGMRTPLLMVFPAGAGHKKKRSEATKRLTIGSNGL